MALALVVHKPSCTLQSPGSFLKRNAQAPLLNNKSADAENSLQEVQTLLFGGGAWPSASQEIRMCTQGWEPLAEEVPHILLLILSGECYDLILQLRKWAHGPRGMKNRDVPGLWLVLGRGSLKQRVVSLSPSPRAPPPKQFTRCGLWCHSFH